MNQFREITLFDGTRLVRADRYNHMLETVLSDMKVPNVFIVSVLSLFLSIETILG